jgi:hypothetical protein
MYRMSFLHVDVERSKWLTLGQCLAPLRLRGHSMDSKESKISLGLDSNMTHEPHQAGGLLDPTP